MRVEYHPAVEEFKTELRRVITLVAAKPGRFHLIKAGFHRANLKRFPYHLIYCELAHGIRVTLVRHHRREPRLGMERE